MKIIRLETFLANGGLRNYLFIRLTTDTGLQGVGEASLEWQERTVECLIHEWVEERVLGCDPFAIEALIGGLIRDQYQGGATVMTAISGIEIACWDIIGKACGQPLYQLLGGRARDELTSYANGWYGGASTADDYVAAARRVVSLGFTGMKFDPFDTAWKNLDREAMNRCESLVSAVRTAVGDDIDLMIEGHGRLSTASAIAIGRRLERFAPAWFEEPVAPLAIRGLREVRAALNTPITAGERMYAFEEFEQLISSDAVDIVNCDPAHCGGLHVARKIATLAEARSLQLAPHCSIGPVALCAAVHFGWATPNVKVQEDFSAFDVPWRNEFVSGISFSKPGGFELPTKPGLGIELDTGACARHPYVKNSFPSLWDRRWIEEFTKSQSSKAT
jgi:galactonate dehydratase